MTLQKCLLDFIDKHMPGVNGAARVRVQCCELGKWPLISGQGGITYLGTIHMAETMCPRDPCDFPVKALLHEFVHIEQQERWPGLFYPWYGLEFLFWLAIKRDTVKAYHAGHFEEEAYRRENELFNAYMAENPCHCPQYAQPPPPPPREPPSGEPITYTEAEVAKCCQSGNDDLEIIFFRQSAADVVRATTEARSQCGVSSLTMRTSVLINGTVQTTSTQKSDQGGCVSFRLLTSSQSNPAGNVVLNLEAEATSCCGKQVSKTFSVN